MYVWKIRWNIGNICLYHTCTTIATYAISRSIFLQHPHETLEIYLWNIWNIWKHMLTTCAFSIMSPYCLDEWTLVVAELDAGGGVWSSPAQQRNDPPAILQRLLAARYSNGAARSTTVIQRRPLAGDGAWCSRRWGAARWGEGHDATPRRGMGHSGEGGATGQTNEWPRISATPRLTNKRSGIFLEASPLRC
jgi:hypothetical protein